MRDKDLGAAFQVHKGQNIIQTMACGYHLEEKSLTSTLVTTKHITAQKIPRSFREHFQGELFHILLCNIEQSCHFYH